MAEVAELVKGGETAIITEVERSLNGLRIKIKALPKVEDFFKNLSQGVGLVATVGRMWAPIPADRELRYYAMENRMTAGMEDPFREVSYNMVNVGHALLENPEEQRPLVNLSFLRLVGISDPEGVSFYLRGGVYSKPEVKRIRDQIVAAQRQFYYDYMQPLHYAVMVSLQDLRG